MRKLKIIKGGTKNVENQAKVFEYNCIIIVNGVYGNGVFDAARKFISKSIRFERW